MCMWPVIAITNSCTLIINYIPEHYTETNLESLFRPICADPQEQSSYTSCKIVRRSRDGRSRSFGFVTYGNEADANHAITTLSGLKLDDKNLKVAKSRSGEDIVHATILIKKIPSDWKECHILKCIGLHRDVVYCRLTSDKKGDNSPMAYVLFGSRSEACAAVAHLCDFPFQVSLVG